MTVSIGNGPTIKNQFTANETTVAMWVLDLFTGGVSPKLGRATCWFTKPVMSITERFLSSRAKFRNIEETELARQQMIGEQKQKYT